jgi:hypothetical protein
MWVDPNTRSSAAMTCAGLLGLAMADAVANESALRAGPKGKDSDTKRGGTRPARDISNDPEIKRGLAALGTALVNSPVQKDHERMPGSGDFEPRKGVRPGGGKPPKGFEPPQGAPKPPKGFEPPQGPPKGFEPPQGAPKPPKGFEPPLGKPQGKGPGGGFQPPQGFGPPEGMMPNISPSQGGRAYYFLWSLERVAVAYGLETIDKKDWYNWGAEILLANQQGNGSWIGSHGTYGADTCFALLFLRRADLAKDLSHSLKGKVKDQHELRGGVGFKGKGSIKPIKSPFEETGEPGRGDQASATKPKERPSAPSTTVDPDVAKLSAELLDAPPSRWTKALEKLRDTQGAQYTAALAHAITQLEGDLKKKAREALAERLSNRTPATLGAFLQDEDAELRRAAALACAMKDDKTHISKLIELLNDSERSVERAAYAALKSLTKQDFGPASDATDAEKTAAVKAWKGWWKKQAEK